MRWLWFTTFSIVIFLTGFFTGWYWIWATIFVLIDIFFTGLFNWSFIKQRVLRKQMPFWLHLSIWLLITSMLLRIFVFESITVMSTGMETELKKGDNILVNKLIIGPRVPITPINFPFTHHYLPFSKNKPSYLTKPAIPYIRLKGLREIHRGDILAYNFPEGDSVYFGAEHISYYALSRLKAIGGAGEIATNAHYRPVDRRELELSRCLSIPGDTILFENGLAFINGSREHIKSTRLQYLIEVDNARFSKKLFEEFGLSSSEITIILNKGYLVSLTTEQSEKIKTHSGIINIHVVVQPGLKSNYQIFPHTASLPWNSDHFGPVIVPSRGDLIELNLQNICLYERLIKVYEGNKLLIKDNTIYINDIAASQYRVKLDYYFIAGDNRHLSRDSRHWGFLPEDHIIGKPWLICLSLSPRKGKGVQINWDRIFDLVK